jgi:hypothetical protein
VLDGFTRDERLQNSADTRTRGITAVAFLNGPRATDDANNHIGGGRDAFFGDEEVQLARPGQAESRKQSLLRDRVLHEVDVLIEVKAKWDSPARPTRCADGTREKRFTEAGPSARTAAWEGPQLKVAYDVGRAGTLTYTYFVVPTTGQLLIRVNCERVPAQPGPFDIKLVYNRRSASTAAPR